MELYQAIRDRRSARKYLSDPVPDDVLDRLLEAAQWAPSWAHTQCCEVVAVSDPAVKQALQHTLAETNPAYRAMAEAPLVLAFCGRRGRAGFKKGEAATPRGDWLLFDVGLAMENFMLAARAEGLGTVCVGLFDAAAAARVLQAPPEVDVVALTPLGYPAGETKVPPRKERAQFVRWNRYPAA
ncbi:MAG: nitroreductase family protein [Deferrisomatales bacterium]|nr:nitroreductase family protein [Deferrisomatales bacterium]